MHPQKLNVLCITIHPNHREIGPIKKIKTQNLPAPFSTISKLR